MKILMMTNTYAPMVGGIEESIRSFGAEFVKLGHEVVIVAPECAGVLPDEEGVIRLRAIQNFNNSNFSIALPMSGLLPELMKTFMPDIVHSHHPFWMGDIAMRLSSQYRIPLVFTYHTMFEQHMHYLPIQNEGTKHFIIKLFTGYANLANQVIVPSESVRQVLHQRGVKTPMEVIPTGLDLQRFSKGNGNSVRKRFGIPSNAVVIGTVGRLAKEKNLEFLSQCVAGYLKKDKRAHFLVVGKGPDEDLVKKIFNDEGVGKRLHLAGILREQDLVDSYHAMNIFAFASKSETQGMVLTEAMAAGVPVVAIDAPGVREVVKDCYNGRLLFGENQKNFTEALSWCLSQSSSDFQTMKKNALATTKEFSVELSAQKMLKVYGEVRAREYISSDLKKSGWFSLMNRLKTEWDMFKSMLGSGGSAMMDPMPVAPQPSPKKLKDLLIKLPRLITLSEWSAKLLKLPLKKRTQKPRGLILIQIDGFSMTQLKQAFAKKKMPFLKGLLQKKYYQMYPFYPGLPSSTPSVQAELFYGVKQIVPAFSFVDHESGKILRMYDSAAAIEIERRLMEQGTGLLEGGSSYSNIYSGGAKESHFCAALLGWNRIWKEVNPIGFVVLLLTQLPSFVRMLVLTVWEIILGIVDFGRGVLHGENFKKELKFIYLRALICVLLRELVTVGTKIDIIRGLPIIHLNFLGYDELAHNRGPSSKSAHWSLLGIDSAIERIYRKAMHSFKRNYDVWVYSDHGQEETDSYTVKYGRTVQEAVAEILKEFDATAELLLHPLDKVGEQLQRVRFLGPSVYKKYLVNMHSVDDSPVHQKLVVTAIGPTGNIYFPREMSNEEKHQFARKLVEIAKIPAVMLAEGQDAVRVWREDGEFLLPEDANKIFGDNHPFLKQVTEDTIRLNHHPSAGNFTFMGFRPGVKPMTFPIENGSHAGPGPEETNAFALLPIDVLKTLPAREYLTPMDLREAAQNHLKRTKDAIHRQPLIESQKLFAAVTN